MRKVSGAVIAAIFLVLAIIMAPKQKVAGFAPSHVAQSRRSRALEAFNHEQNRRSILKQGALLGSIVTKPSIAAAVENPPPTPTQQQVPPLSTKPYASLDALLPAARVKIVIDKSVTIASKLTNSDSNANTARQETLVVQELQNLLLTPQNYTRSSQLADVPKQPAKQYLDSYKKNIDQLNILEKPGGLLVQSGEIDTWKRLKRQERARESADEVRAAFNAYTSNLSFSGDSYKLNVPKEERSRMIRQDSLPDIKNVIASDMGMRYLYRNEVLTNMQDARAELRYQLQQEDFDATELLEILRNAQASCNRWFGLIDESDVQTALEAATQ